MNKNPKVVVGLFFVVFLVAGLSIYKDYGISSDEKANHDKGIHNFNYVFKADDALLTYKNRDYGVAFELPLIIVEKLFNLEDSRDIYLMRHLCTFLLFYASVYFFYLLCKNHFGSWKIGLLGSVFLVISPRIFANSFYNSKDLAFMSMFIISAYAMIKYLDKKTLPRASLHAITSAILINIRIIGILIPFLTLFFVCVGLLKRKNSKRIVQSLSVYLSLAVFFTVLFWPFLWESPVNNFIQTIKGRSNFCSDEGRRCGTVLYLGDHINVIDLPWHYIPSWIGITTPPLYTFGFFAGLLALVKKRKNNDSIFLSWFFLPLFVVIALKTELYDGWRHMYFIYPAFLVISLKGLAFLFGLARSKLKGQKYSIANMALIFAILVSLVSTTQFMVRNHPYQNVYFNRLIGRNIRENFDLDYWGLSYRQALEYILANDTGETIRVHVTTNPGRLNAKILTPANRDRLIYVHKPDNAKYVLSNYGWHKEGFSYKDEFYSIIVDGTKIMTTYKLS